jgi:general secretion pathway protein G
MRAWEENTNCGFRIYDGGLKQASGANPQSAIRHPPSRRAFTLIELMLVLVILATLAAIVTPRLTGQSKRAKVIASQAQIADLGTALDAFEIGVGRYPTTVEGLQALIQQPTSEAQDWQGPYLNKNVVPLDPWGNEYQYRCPGQYNPDGYDLYCYGPDGKQGGDDDISNWSDEVRK